MAFASEACLTNASFQCIRAGSISCSGRILRAYAHELRKKRSHFVFAWLQPRQQTLSNIHGSEVPKARSGWYGGVREPPSSKLVGIFRFGQFDALTCLHNAIRLAGRIMNRMHV